MKDIRPKNIKHGLLLMSVFLAGCATGGNVVNQSEKSTTTSVVTTAVEKSTSKADVVKNESNGTSEIGIPISSLENNFKNEAFKQAFEAYQSLLESVTLADHFVKDGEGTTIDQFSKFDFLTEPFEDVKLNEDEVMRMYSFVTDEPFSKDVSDDPGKANLIAVFTNDKLTYLGVHNNSFLFSEASILDVEKVKNVAKKAFDYQEIAVEDPVVLGLGTLVVNGNHYRVVSMPSGKVESLGAEIFAVVNNQLDYIQTTSLTEVTENGAVTLLNALEQYIVDYSNEFYRLTPPENAKKENEE